MKETVNFTDTLTLDAPRRTAEHGYLAATAIVARTGIQKYRGFEVGRPDVEWVRVFRPEEEVFHEDAMKSFAHRPVTNDHPPVPVTSDNWKKYAVGQVGDEVMRDGHVVKVPILLMDASVIKDYENGKRQISQGYSCELIWGEGKTPAGEIYDAKQTQIRANHTAVVDAARAGPDVRIVDNKGEGSMNKTIMVDGLPIEVTDKDAAIVQKALSTADAKIATLTTELKRVTDEFGKTKEELEKEKEEAKKAAETKDAEIVTLKKQVDDSAVTPAKLDVLVKDRAEVVAAAKVVLGDKLVVDGKTNAEIRRQVVDANLGAAAKGWSDDAVAASFSTLVARNVPQDQLAGALGSLIQQDSSMDALDKAYEKRDYDLSNAWKTKAA